MSLGGKSRGTLWPQSWGPGGSLQHSPKVLSFKFGSQFFPFLCGVGQLEGGIIVRLSVEIRANTPQTRL